MKHTKYKSKLGASGFTLVELLVAMTITVVLVGMLVYMGSTSMDAFNDTRNEVRASRQAKQAMDRISRDFESIVLRRDGNDVEWLYSGDETSSLRGPSGREIPNTNRVIFFTAATDRYNGEINTENDNGGDVSAVSYRLVYRDQISDSDAEEYAVFSLYRNLADPDEAFDLIAEDDLLAQSATVFSDNEDLAAENFLVENIYEFTLTFIVKYTDENEAEQIERVVMAQGGSGFNQFSIRGNTLESSPALDGQANTGTLDGVEVSITVLTDRGMTLAKNSGISQEELLKNHSFHYTKSIITPNF